MPIQPHKRRTTVHRLIPVVLSCGVLVGVTFASNAKVTSQSNDADTTTRVTTSLKHLEISDRDSIVLQFPDWLTRVASDNPDVVHVTAISPSSVRVRRKSEGTTLLTARDRSGHSYGIALKVMAKAP